MLRSICQKLGLNFTKVLFSIALLQHSVPGCRLTDARIGCWHYQHRMGPSRPAEKRDRRRYSYSRLSTIVCCFDRLSEDRKLAIFRPLLAGTQQSIQVQTKADDKFMSHCWIWPEEVELGIDWKRVYSAYFAEEILYGKLQKRYAYEEVCLISTLVDIITKFRKIQRIVESDDFRRARRRIRLQRSLCAFDHDGTGMAPSQFNEEPHILVKRLDDVESRSPGATSALDEGGLNVIDLVLQPTYRSAMQAVVPS